ncbi:flavin reductase family protein [Oceanibacterium hippocampi]|uniref:p-hydroxyphenylacetate 3-hydroxylase, reductase component n=1 Tax=Oceanibacterium hippocampi TaxID=745714 RepID=A0A1Y5SNL2_9PROT|nr:flavin reductase family protein [Oceanibacterium hippocampi]SLN41857.1 p-hydroxyphenylacetate 3-hydroxylase, reductase component [Oceanibacterium hippocampi]
MAMQMSNHQRETGPGPAWSDREFRDALGSFPTGVTIVTTRTGDGHPVGLTCNSFSSVSLSPPLILWSLLKTSSNVQAFSEASHFGVSVLSQGQKAISNLFAGRDKRFDDVAVLTAECGVLLIDGAAAHFECATEGRLDGGDHFIFLGRVLNFTNHRKPPLIFHGGNYNSLAE